MKSNEYLEVQDAQLKKEAPGIIPGAFMAVYYL
jgi:hypothetical protein